MQMMNKHSKVARMLKDIMRYAPPNQSSLGYQHDTAVSQKASGNRKIVFKSDEKVFMPKYTSTRLSSEPDEPLK
jgi:hypothetical protein